MRKFDLKTLDRVGYPHVFAVEEERADSRPPRWIYRIHSQDQRDFFELHFAELDNGMLQVEVVENHGLAEFQAMGIPDALYRHVAKEKKCTIRSSRNVPEHEPPDPLHPEPEFLTPSARKVWERLQAAGDARFDNSAQRWFLSGTDAAHDG